MHFKIHSYYTLRRAACQGKFRRKTVLGKDSGKRMEREGEMVHDCDGLLKEIISQAREVGIPVSQNIDPHVRINKRAVTRFGCCR